MAGNALLGDPLGINGGGSTTSTSTNSVPQYLQDAGQKLVNQSQTVADRAYQANPYLRQAGWTPQQQQAQQMTQQLAANGSSAVNAANGSVTGLLNGGANNSANPYLTQMLDGGAPNPSAGFLTQQMNGQGAQNPSNPYLQTAANGVNNGANSLLEQTANGSYLDPSTNPSFKASIDRAMGDVSSKVNSQFALGGAFGGSANQELLSRNLGDTATQMYGQQYANERQNQLSAQGQLSNNYSTAQQQQLSAAQALGNNYATGQNQQLGAAQVLGNQYSTGQAQQLAAMGQLGSNYNAGLMAQNQAASLAPTLDSARYTGANALNNLGGQIQTYNQNDINNQSQAWQNEWNYPTQQLQTMANGISGAMGTGTQTQTQQTPYFTNPVGNALGMASTGLGIYNQGVKSNLWGNSSGAGSSATGSSLYSDPFGGSSGGSLGSGFYGLGL